MMKAGFQKAMLLFSLVLFVFASAKANTPRYTQNRGQWNPNVLFRAEYSGGALFVDKQGMTFMMLENGFFDRLHHWMKTPAEPGFARAHALKMNFLNADMSGEPLLEKQVGAPQNYFLGSNPDNWATGVYANEKVTIPGVYPKIDAEFAAAPEQLKYSFIVHPGGDPAAIKVAFAGQNSLYIKDGALRAETDLGWVSELAPFAYQIGARGDTLEVECRFSLDGNTVSYALPNGYDPARPLVIDPILAFSTYIGSNASSFGFTASYDESGHAYAGAVSFGFEYPTVTGSYEISFGYGVVDCGITKFTPDGSDLMYSTFLGGTSGESPHSLVVNDNNELYVLGSTGSNNFPVSGNAYQQALSGGPQITAVGYSYLNGSDMFVAKFSADGSNLLGSTYIGGSNTDGVGSGQIFNYNYGDNYRGEIVVDDAGNAYVASVTASDDFPVVGGYAGSNGNNSGVIFKLSSDMSDLLWSTYSGGGSDETAYSLQLAPDNSVYFTGSTTSGDLPTSANAYQPDKLLDVDGYIGHISADGSQLLNCTYNGTNGYEQNYFVQLDLDGNVYVVGQTTGYYPTSGDVYGNANSNQYIQKFNADLSDSEWSTQVGSGNGISNFSPSAFLVSYCGQIYLSGWGGSLSNNGTTDNLPISDDAFQSTTDGEDFYLMVLAPDAESLVYGTYFGGSQSPEHVDGGTSRFDKNGTVYQAVCAGCFGNSDFPSTPGVWSPDNGSDQCNMGVMKFKLSSVSAVAEVDAPEVVCPGTSFDLNNLSIDADAYLWYLDDGTTSTETEFSYSFDEPGTYDIKLVATNNSGCILPDSTTISIEVESEPDIEADDPPPVCPGETVQLEATGADSWEWIPAIGLDVPSIAAPTFVGESSTEYTVVGTTPCGTDTAYVEVTVGNLSTEVSDNQTICPGDSVQLEATGGVAYTWTPEAGLSDPNSANPMASPEFTTGYQVEITTGDGCNAVETVNVIVLPPPPELSGDDRYVSCNGEAVSMDVEGADTYSWSPATGLNATDIPNPTANPATATTYTVTGTNQCGDDQLEVEVLVSDVEVSIQTDSVVCYDTPFFVEAHGASSYIWQPADRFVDSHEQMTQAFIEKTTKIQVTGFDTLGCFDTESAMIRLYPRAIVRAGNDFVINYGEEVQLESSSIYPIQWDYSPYLSCLDCNYPIASPPENTTFYATIESPDGCVETDSVRVNVRGLIYVPNAFTPDGDGLNDFFKAKGVDISEFKMEIYDRWGSLVFISDDIDRGWNGSFRGDGYYCPPDIYQYRIVATEHEGEVFELRGHITLLR